MIRTTYTHTYCEYMSPVKTKPKDKPLHDETRFRDVLPANESEITASIHIDGRIIFINGKFNRNEFGENVGFVKLSSFNGAVAFSVKLDDTWKYSK